ncbi:Succinate-semialdehyde dehydrogenase, mitochondrial [Nymphon striatum]|nr:Succinate-semialdehyde dehydrogenase, mitochondrial [Nymphon striatum]
MLNFWIIRSDTRKSFQPSKITWSLYQQAYCSSSFTIPDKCYIDGKWIPSESGKVFNVINPFNDAVIGQVPDCSDADTQLAISAAKKAFQSWKTSTSMGEVLYGASYFEWFAEEVRRVYGEVLISQSRSNLFVCQILYVFRNVRKFILGILKFLSPYLTVVDFFQWNFPNAMLARKVAAVIAAGCTCVIKPAEDTPYSALAIVKILEECGVPPGVVNIVTSSKENAPTIGKTLSKSPDVRIMSFTGSTAILMEQSASTVKKIGMELGGNAPFIVFESADMKKAIDGAIASKFRHSGQTCVCSNQFLIQENVHDEFVEKLLDKMNKSLILGDPTNEKTTIGPLINKQALEKIHEHIVTTLLRIGIGSRRYTYDMRTNYSDSSTSSGLS